MRPWDRVKVPTPIPSPCSAVSLRLMDESTFSELLRSNLLPRQDGEGFRRLWITIAFNDDLSHRAFDVLEDWLDQVEESDADDVRVRKFATNCDGAWNRLTGLREFDSVAPRSPSPGSSAFVFVAAILEHQAQVEVPTPLDDALWATVSAARDRAKKSRDNTRDWASTPTFTSQLVESVKEHRRLCAVVRPEDSVLWGILR